MELGFLGSTLSSSAGVFWGKCIGSKKHLDWLKIDLHTIKIITVQDYKRIKK